MASRQEEKERLRRERIAREEAERRSAARRKRMTVVLGALGALLAVAALAFAITQSSGSDSPEEGQNNEPDPPSNVQLPPVQTADLEEAAKKAGCVVRHPEIDGAGLHEVKEFTAGDYNSNPPTSGTHHPQWYEDGVYEPGDANDLGMLVHTLEHGRIDVQYKPGTPKETVDKLEAFLAESDGGYHMLLFENTTDMRYEVAATAWGHLLGCREMNDDAFDALRAFRTSYIDQGPEQVP